MKNKITAKPGSMRQNKTGSWRTYRPNIDLEKCIGCGNCALVCPEGVIEMLDTKPKKTPKVDYDFCKGCGVCTKECPVKAIEMGLDTK